jgi:hypothetical protein
MTAVRALGMVTLLVSLTASVPAAGALCVGDCSGDNAVAIDELLVGIDALLAGAPPACAAWGERSPPVSDVVRGVLAALHGCPLVATPTMMPTASQVETATPTNTATPTPMREPLLAAVAEPFEAACRVFGIGGRLQAQRVDGDFSLFCVTTASHETRIDIRRYASAAAANLAFGDARGTLPALELDGIPAAYGERPFHTNRMCTRLDCGLIREMAWQLECWVATLRSDDDTHFIYSLDPQAVSHAILAAAGDALRADCAAD